GTSPPALWVALPIALAVAAYAPGTMPFAVGQAAFTVVVLVLFNLLAPAGWKVGLLRVEDVALGGLVSLVVGVLFWPRGAASLAGLQAPEHAWQHKHRGTAYARTALAHAAADLAGFYERVAVLVGRPVAHQVVLPVSVPPFTGLNLNGSTTESSGTDVEGVEV